MIYILSIAALLLPFALYLPAYDGVYLVRNFVVQLSSAAMLYILVRGRGAITIPLLWIPVIALVVLGLRASWRTPLYLQISYKLLQLLVLYSVVVIGANLSGRELRSAIVFSAIGAAISSAIALAQAGGWEGIPQAFHPAAFFVNRNLLGEYLIGVIPAGYWIACRKRGWFVALALMLAALYTVNCRGAILGLVIGLATVTFISHCCLWKRLTVVGLLAGAGTYAWWLSYTVPARMFGYTERMLMWKYTLPMIRDNPLGVGIGGWQQQFPIYDRIVAILVFGLPRSPHNDLMWFTAEYGIPGLGVLCVIGWMIGRSIWHNRHMPESLVCAASCVGLFVASNFSFTSENAAALFLPLLLVGYTWKDA